MTPSQAFATRKSGTAADAKSRKDLILKRLTELRPKYQELFNFYDHDHDGVLGKDEFRFFFQAVLILKGYSPRKAKEEALSSYKGRHRSDNIFAYYCPNTTGRISFNDFWTHMYTDNLVPRDEAKLLKIQQLFPNFKPPPPALKRLSRPMSVLNVSSSDRVELTALAQESTSNASRKRPAVEPASAPAPDAELTFEHLADLQTLTADVEESHDTEKELVGLGLPRSEGYKPLPRASPRSQNTPRSAR